MVSVNVRAFWGFILRAEAPTSLWGGENGLSHSFMG